MIISLPPQVPIFNTNIQPIIFEKPAEEPVVEEPPLYTLQEKIDLNINNCDETIEYIRADNAECLLKPVSPVASAEVVINPAPATKTSRQAHNTSSNTYSPGYCTWGVKSWASWVPNGWSHASRWVGRARAAGYTVSNIPTVGSVASYKGGNHVALVIAVNGSDVTIKEMNYKRLYDVNTRTTPASSWTYIR